jgi:hypothetical protein
MTIWIHATEGDLLPMAISTGLSTKHREEVFILPNAKQPKILLFM